MTIKLTSKQRIIIRSSDDVFKIMKEILLREDKIDREKEHFWVVGLANNLRIRYVELISMGSVSNTVVEPMNVFRWSVMKGCVQVIMVHNHPSGNLKPSAIDIDLTDHLFQVGRILNINVLDHLIISTKSYMSFADTKLLEKLAESTKYVPSFELIERIRAEERKIREEAVRVAEKKGKNEGLKEGEIRGIEKEKIKIARGMKKKGFSIKDIIELTGLTKREIEKIK
ncbi:MAG: DNA repair protein [Bacteroidales bacterium]|nr:DNA repair protein [Bacteroidales bacterium]